jgi:hypothetical protein
LRPTGTGRRWVCNVCRIRNSCEGPPDPNACWIWKGAIRNGYGVTRAWVKNRSRVINVNRQMYAETRGDPGYRIVKHGEHCRTKLCCNPAHLYLATPLEVDV